MATAQRNPHHCCVGGVAERSTAAVLKSVVEDAPTRIEAENHATKRTSTCTTNALWHNRWHIGRSRRHVAALLCDSDLLGMRDLLS
jgi:hypothetical protein